MNNDGNGGSTLDPLVKQEIVFCSRFFLDSWGDGKVGPTSSSPLMMLKVGLTWLVYLFSLVFFWRPCIGFLLLMV